MRATYLVSSGARPGSPPQKGGQAASWTRPRLTAYLALVAAVSVIALAVTLGLRPDPTDERAVAANRTDVNPWAAVPPTTARPPRLDAPVAAVGREVAAHEAERASRSRRDVGGGVGGGGGGSIAGCESGGDYGAVNGSSGAGGKWQFLPSTWDSTARSAGRPDLVGVAPQNATPTDQDAMFAHLWDGGRGASHWSASRGCWG